MSRLPPDDQEISLDPTDWQEFRRLGHRMVDDMLDYLATLSARPAWQPMPEAVRRSFDEPLPKDGAGPAAAYAEFVARVLPYPNGNLHPRFWGWVQGNGTPLGMMADMLAAGLNPHMAGFNQAPALVEHQVIAWLAEMLGLPKGASGVMVSGGSMANTLGLAVARHARAGFDVRREGLQGSGKPLLVLYVSCEVHGWAQRAVEFMGLGRDALRVISVGPDYRMNLDELATAIEIDTSRGLKPFCVVGTAGTVNTGATDDLLGIAAICRERGLWFHVDGAFGALARLSDSLRPVVAGLEHADSVGFDLHKWMYLPFEAACVLVRDALVHHDTFSMNPSYLATTDRGVMAGGLPFADRGMDLTRSFKALKVWMSLKAYGVQTFARLIEQNVRQAQHLAAAIDAAPDFQLLAPAPLNVVCFRYAPPNAPADSLNALNLELLLRLQETGRAVPSSTMLDGRFALRVANVNHRTRTQDFDDLLAACRTLGSELVVNAPPDRKQASRFP